VSKSPKFFLGDDDSNSSDILNDEKEKKPASVAPSETDSVVSEKNEGECKKSLDLASSANKPISGSWSMLKNAAKTTGASTVSSGHSASAASLASETTAADKTAAVDSFQKYRMQLKEKEKMLREQESLRAQREKEQAK
jgi:hypothetical protein